MKNFCCEARSMLTHVDTTVRLYLRIYTHAISLFSHGLLPGARLGGLSATASMPAGDAAHEDFCCLTFPGAERQK